MAETPKQQSAYSAILQDIARKSADKTVNNLAELPVGTVIIKQENRWYVCGKHHIADSSTLYGALQDFLIRMKEYPYGS